jgi:hypothetical protein
MSEQRYACGLTADDVLALTDKQLVTSLYGMLDLLEPGKATSWAVWDSVVLFLDELTERYVPEARYVAEQVTRLNEPAVGVPDLPRLREAMRAREGARILLRELGDA